jgi:hypothetical protein
VQAAASLLSRAVDDKEEDFLEREAAGRVRTAWGAWRRLVLEERPLSLTGSSVGAWAASRLVRICWTVARLTRQPLWVARAAAVKDALAATLTASERLHAGLPSKSARAAGEAARESLERPPFRARAERTFDGSLASAHHRASTAWQQLAVASNDAVSPPGGRRRLSVASAVEGSRRGGSGPRRASNAHLPPAHTLSAVAPAAPPLKSESSSLLDLEIAGEEMAESAGRAAGLSIALHRPLMWRAADIAARPALLRLSFLAWKGWMARFRAVRTRAELAACGVRFDQWRENAAESAVARRAAFLVDGLAAWQARATSCSLRRALVRLQAHAKLARRVRAVAARTRMCKLRASWGPLALAAARTSSLAKRCDAAAGTLALLRAAQCVARWRKATAHAAVIQRCVYTVEMRRAVAVFQWAANASAALRAKLSGLAEHVRTRRATSALQGWIAVTRATRLWRTRCAAMTDRLQAGRHKRALRRWRAMARVRAALGSVLASVQISYAAAPLAAWRAVAVQRSAAKRVASAAIVALSRSSLVRAARMWAARAGALARKREDSERAELHAAVTSATRALCALRRYARTRVSIRAVTFASVAARRKRSLVAAVSAWRTAAVVAAAQRPLDEAAAVRRDMWMLRRSVRRLLAWARMTAPARDTARAAAAVIDRRHCTRAVSRWLSWAHKVARWRRAAEVAAATRAHDVQYNVLTAWAAVARLRRKREIAVAAVQAWAACRGKQLALTAWRGYATASRDGREEAELTEVAVLHWSTRVLRAAVLAWRTNAHTQVIAGLEAATMRDVVLRPSWNAWRAWAAVKARISLAAVRAAAGVRAKALMKAVAAWRAHTAFETVSHSSALAHDTRKLATAFVGWRALVASSLRVRTAGYELATRVQRRAAQRAVTAWCAQAAGASRMRRLQHSAIRLWSIHLVGEPFSAWARWARGRVAGDARITAAADSLRRSSAVRALRAWKQEVDPTVPGGSFATRIFAVACRRLHLTAAVGAWADQVRTQHRVFAATTAVQAAGNVRAASGVLAVWARAARSHRGAEALRVRLQGRVLSAAFAALAAYGAARRQQREQHLEAVTFLARLHASRALSTWRAALISCARRVWASSVAGPKLATRARKVLLRRAFGDWHSAAAYIGRLREIGETSAAKRAHRALVMGLEALQANAVAREEHRARAQAGVEALRAHRARVALRKWTQAWRHVAMQMQGGAEEEVAERARLRRLRSCLGLWRRSMRRINAAQYCEANEEEVVCRTVVASWGAWAAERTARRALTLTATAHLEQFRTWCSLAAWRTATAASASLREKQAEAEAALRRRRVREAVVRWDAWRLHVAQVKARVHALRVWRLERALASCLALWHASTPARREEREEREGTALARAHARRAIGARVLRAWADVVRDDVARRSEKLHAAAAAADGRRVAAAFDRWRFAALLGRARHIALRTLITRCAVRQWSAAAAAAH